LPFVAAGVDVTTVLVSTELIVPGAVVVPTVVLWRVPVIVAGLIVLTVIV